MNDYYDAENSDFGRSERFPHGWWIGLLPLFVILCLLLYVIAQIAPTTAALLSN